MKILVIGSGGREHAICWKIKQSPLCKELFCAPGNAGTSQIATNIKFDLNNLPEIAGWAKENKIDLTVVGPEAPLAAGIVNIFEAEGLKIFGPSAAAAELESSKSFAKEVMLKAGVNTAEGQVFDDFSKASAYLDQVGVPIVVKADGLAAGKGVVVAETKAEALQALKDFMIENTLGESGSRVVIEKCLNGEEASVMAIIDGETVLPLVVSQDYKRLLDGNNGPNTGGMGAVSPTPALSEERLPEMVESIFLPVVKEMASRGIYFRGFLYAGVMVDSDGTANVLEFNCRLGDPEAEILLLRLKSDLVEILLAAVKGNLASKSLAWHEQAAACVVAASKGYPENPEKGKDISGLGEDSLNLVVFHAGTKFDSDNKKVITNGGRVLVVSALGDSTEDALSRVYQRLQNISFEGIYYRKKIGEGHAKR